MASAWLLLPVLAALTGAGVSCGTQPPAKSKSDRQQPAAVRTAKVYAGSLEQTVRLAGVTAAESAAMLLAPQLRGSRGGGGLNTAIGGRASRTSSISGTFMGAPGGGGPGRGAGDFSLVLQMLVAPGSWVKKGDVVSEFDRQNMLERLDDYRTSMAQVDAAMDILDADQLSDMKSQMQLIAVAKADLDKALIDLKTTPVRGDIDRQKLKLTAEEAQARYKELEGDVALRGTSQKSERRVAEIERQQARMELQRSEANAERMLVRAPMDGITVMQTIMRGGEPGQIQQGDSLRPGQPYMRVVDTNSMVVNASVNQVDVERIRVGAKARVRFDAYPGLELPAHVHSIAAMPQGGGFRASYVKQVPVVLKLEQVERRVIPDLSVSGDVVLARVDQVVMAPLEAVFRDPGTGRAFVYLRQPSGWQQREVELGLASHLAVEVRSGLRPGDVMATEAPGRAAVRSADGEK